MNRRLPLLRVLLTAHVSFVMIVWLALAVVTALATLGMTLWGHVDTSTWHYTATQVPRWFALGLGFDLINTYLRLHVSHGRTRREFLRQLWPYFVSLSAVFALLIAISYVIERGVYALAGLSHQLRSPALFGSPDNFLGVFGAFTLMLTLWTIAGALLAAAFTRNVVLGLFTVPIGLLLVVPSEFLVGSIGVPLFRDVIETLRLPALTGIGLCLVGVVVGCAALWGVVRDIQVRPKIA